MKPEISIYVSARVSRFACLGGLLTRGAFVLCIDNFFTGASRNIEDLLDHKYFEVIRHVPLYVEEDEIFSLACSPQRSIINMIQTKTSVRDDRHAGLANRLGLGSLWRPLVILASSRPQNDRRCSNSAALDFDRPGVLLEQQSGSRERTCSTG